MGDGHVGDRPGGGAAAVEAARQDLAGPLGEGVEVDGAAEQLRPFGRHLPDPAEGDEDLPAAQLDDQAERARRLAARDRPDDHVADPADGAAVAVEQRPPGEAGGEHLNLRVRPGGASWRSRGSGHPTIIMRTLLHGDDAGPPRLQRSVAEGKRSSRPAAG